MRRKGGNDDEEGEFSRLLDEYQQAMEQGTVSTFWNGRICSEDARARITQIGSTVGEVELYFADAQMKPPLDSELYFVEKGLSGFEIERELGRGSNGIVYLALDTRLNRLVAIKIPRLASLASASAREPFRQEAQLAACIDHPHVLPISKSECETKLEQQPMCTRWERCFTSSLQVDRHSTQTNCLLFSIKFELHNPSCLGPCGRNCPRLLR